jgi:hypothetical protein
MLTAVLVVMLAQSQEPLKLAAPGLSCVGFESALGDVYLEHFVTVLGRTEEIKITTRRDIQEVLGLERQKQLVGCMDDGSSCLAELAGGLGVDGLISGSLAKTGSGYTVTLRILRSRDGAAIASASERLKDEDALGEWLEAEAPRMAVKILAAFGRVQKPKRNSWVPWVPGIAGAACAIGGGVSLGVSSIKAGSLDRGEVAVSGIQSTIDTGRTLQNAGWGLVGVGAAGIVTSVIWVIASGSGSSNAVSIVPVEQGAIVGFGGTFP